jgi:signal transduction histidine kinase
MGQHVHELLHVAAAALLVVAGVSALLEYRTLRERVVLTYGAMCLCAAAYATHVVISHNLPKLGAFWMPWTSAGLVATFGAALFYLLTMRTFLGASSRLLSAAIGVQTALTIVVACDFLFYVATGSSFLFLPVPRLNLTEHQRALGEGAYSLRLLAEVVAGVFMLSFVAGVGYLLFHLVRTRSRDLLVYMGLVANAAIVANDALTALGAFAGVYLIAFSKGFETVRINRDIRARATERVEGRLRQAAKMAAVGRMAGGIAHDFANILQVVGNNLALAGDVGPDGRPINEDLAAASEGLEAGRRLVDQLLDVARAKERVAEYVDVNAFLAQSAKLLNSMVVANATRLEVHSEPALGGVMMDPGQLTQVLMNLVINARDAMPEGGTVKIHATSDSSSVGRAKDLGPSPKIVISVIDEGTGIPANIIEHVFEPFFTTKGPRGTGLGLATLYSIVNRAGGHVEVQSEVGRGTSFHVVLPRCDLAGASPPS